MRTCRTLKQRVSRARGTHLLFTQFARLRVHALDDLDTLHPGRAVRPAGQSPSRTASRYARRPAAASPPPDRCHAPWWCLAPATLLFTHLIRLCAVVAFITSAASLPCDDVVSTSFDNQIVSVVTSVCQLRLGAAIDAFLSDYFAAGHPLCGAESRRVLTYLCPSK